MVTWVAKESMKGDGNGISMMLLQDSIRGPSIFGSMIHYLKWVNSTMCLFLVLLVFSHDRFLIIMTIAVRRIRCSMQKEW